MTDPMKMHDQILEQRTQYWDGRIVMNAFCCIPAIPCKGVWAALRLRQLDGAGWYWDIMANGLSALLIERIGFLKTLAVVEQPRDMGTHLSRFLDLPLDFVDGYVEAWDGESCPYYPRNELFERGRNAGFFDWYLIAGSDEVKAANRPLRYWDGKGLPPWLNFPVRRYVDLPKLRDLRETS